MRQHRMTSVIQTRIYIPSEPALKEPSTHKVTRRATRVLAVVLRLAVGTGVAILVALLSSWMVPSMRATARGTTAVEQVQVQTPFPDELEDIGMAPALFPEDFFTRL